MTLDPVLLGVAGWVLAQFAVGLAVSRHIRDEADYLLAGRTLGPAFATFSLFATWFGAETCLGAAGATYAEGLSGGRADPFGYALCLLGMGVGVAAALRRTGAMTLADVFRTRFSAACERWVVVLLVPASVLWAAAQIRALGQVFSAASHVGLPLAIGLATFVVIAYTVTGGLRADVVTDLVQGVALIVGLAVLLVVVVAHTGGPAAAWAIASAPRAPASLPEAGLFARAETWLVPIVGSITAQELAARVLACRTPGIARNTSVAASALYLSVGLIPVSLGLLGARLVPGLTEHEQVIPVLARTHLHAGLYVVLAGALISAILSTVDSNLLAAASLVAHNGVLRVWTSASERQKLLVARAGVLAAGGVACALAFSRESVYALVEEASAFGGAGMAVALCAGLWTRFGGPWAGLAAIVTGVIVQLGGTYVRPMAQPFTWSLVASAAAYAVVGAVEHGWEPRRHARK